MIPSVFSDHSAIILQVEPLEYGRSGPAFWKLNTTLLNDKYYFKSIKEYYETWKEEYHNSSDFTGMWGFLKFKIRE